MKPYQKAAEKIGASGCYFLCLCYIAEKICGKSINPLEAYFEMVDKKYMKEDCYMDFPNKVLETLTGKKYEVFKADAKYITNKKDFEILRFERKTTMTTYSHFVIGNGLGKVQYDPLGTSMTVKEGVFVSKRIISALDK